MTLQPPMDSSDDDPLPSGILSVTSDAHRAIAALERGGRLTAEQVVEDARDPDSPLHGYFTWDDTEAANAHRLNEARALIRSVKVVVTYENQKVSTPRYVRDTAQPAASQGYVSAEQIRLEPENARALMLYEFGRASAHVSRSIDIAKAVGHGEDATEIMQRIEKLLAKLKK